MDFPSGSADGCLQLRVSPEAEGLRDIRKAAGVAGVEAFLSCMYACLHFLHVFDCVTFLSLAFYGAIFVPRKSSTACLSSPFSPFRFRQRSANLAPFNPARLAGFSPAAKSHFARSRDDRPRFAPAQESKGKLRKSAKLRQVLLVR